MGAVKTTAKNFIFNFLYGNILTMAVRIILGAMFVFSGVMKAYDPETFGRIILLYDLLYKPLVPYAAVFLPYLEIILGLCLVAGYRIKGASALSALLMIAFTVAIVVNLARGNSFECGCFELHRLGLGLEERIGYHLAARDALMLFLFIALYAAKKHVLSVERFLEKRGLRKLR